MTIDFKNGLDYDDLMQIAKAINPILLDPEVRRDFQNGTNAALTAIPLLRSVPFIFNLIPGNLGSHLDSIERLLRLTKGLLDA